MVAQAGIEPAVSVSWTTLRYFSEYLTRCGVVTETLSNHPLDLPRLVDNITDVLRDAAAWKKHQESHG